MPANAVIFDVDGVLVDSYQAHYQSWRQIAVENGWEFSEEQFVSTFGRTSREIIRDRWGAAMSDEDIKAHDFRKEAIYRVLIATDFPEMPGASELIDSLVQASFAVAVGSSGPALNVHAVIDRLDPNGHVKVRITGDHVTKGKPDPQVFTLAAEELDVEPARCVVVEDAPAGIEAAHAAGMKCVAIISTGRTAKELKDADQIIQTLSELSPASFHKLLGPA